MKDRLLKLYSDIIAKWQGMDKTQQRRLIMGAGGLVLALGLTFFIMLRPQWVTLTGANRLEWAEVQQITTALEASGIRYDIQDNSSVRVRRQDFAEASMMVHSATEVFAGRTGSLSFEHALEHMGMGTSDAERNEIFRRVLENDIEMQLLNVSGVTDANVNINLADPRALFLGNTPRPSASVALTTDRVFSPQDATSLVSIVANSVEGLTADHVSITDQNLRTIFNGWLEGDLRFGGSVGEERDYRAMRSAEAEIAARQVMLSMFQNVVASASVEVEANARTVSTITHQSPNDDGTALWTSREDLAEILEGNVAALPEPGAALNAGVPFNAIGAGQQTSGSREVSYVTGVTNVQEEVIIFAAGTPILDTSSIAVTLTQPIVFDQVVMEANEMFEEGMTWELFAMQNVNPITVVDADVDTYRQMIAHATGIPFDNVSVIVQQQPVLVHAIVAPVPWDTIVLLGILAALLLMLAYALIRKGRVEEEIIEIEPELSVEDLLVSTRIEEAVEEELASSLQEIAYSIDSEVKQQIDKFVTEKPEAVAQLLRSWMNEGWE